MQVFENKLKILMSRVKNGQMTEEEYRYISSFLGNKNFLVFGTGYDSDFWRFVNNKGKTVFLEHDIKWIPENKDDVFLINYTSNIKNFKILLREYENKNFLNLEIKIPNFIIEINWDFILVDGPPGNKKNSIGRSQSIYMAKKLSSKNTQIFIHDCNRELEDLYSIKLFKVINQLTKLRHCINEKI